MLMVLYVLSFTAILCCSVQDVQVIINHEFYPTLTYAWQIDDCVHLQEPIATTEALEMK